MIPSCVANSGDSEKGFSESVPHQDGFRNLSYMFYFFQLLQL